jgi:hypothetical protein
MQFLPLISIIRLSMYKFIRINVGPLRGCYHHPSFARNQFDLIDQVGRKYLGIGKEAMDSIKAPASSSTQGSQNKKNKTSTRAISSAALATISGDEDAEFALFDFGDDSETVPEEMPSVLESTMSSMSAPTINEPGISDLQHDASPELAPTKQSSVFDEAATFSLYSHFKPGVSAPTYDRKDILDEIIRTFN